MTAELWAIPAVLLLMLVIGLVALLRGRARPPRPRPSRLPAASRSRHPATTTPRSFEASRPQASDHEPDTEPDNLHTRREAAAEALRQARQRAALDAVRLDALRQSRANAADPASPQVEALPLRRRVPAPAPLRLVPLAPDVSPPVPAPAAPHPGAAPAAPRTEPLPAAPARALAPPALPPAPLPSAAPVLPVQPLAQAAAPARADPRAAVAAVPPLAGAAPPVASPALAPPARPATVLVVDDSKVVRVKTSRLLEKHHYQVLLADDGLTALAALEQQWPDLVITDVEMPGLDGFGLTQRLRGLPGGATMPVIMITSSNDRHRDAATQCGVDVLLGKPYPEAQLLAEVDTALARAAQPAAAGLRMQ